MDLKVLKNKNFTLLILGKTVSMLGSNMQQFALALYVLALTGSATVFASIVAISVLPRIILSPFAGVFGDWFDRKKSIVTIDFINGALISVFAIYFAINGELSIASIYLFVVLLETTEIFFESASTAVLPSIVDKEELFQANSIKTLTQSIGSIMAPIIAALLYGTLGLQIILIINSISFIVSALSELAIEIPKTHKKPEKINFTAFKTDLFEGIKIIKDNKMIMNIIGLGVILNFCLTPVFNIGLIYIIRENLQGSEFQVGIFSAVLSAALILAPITLGGMAKKVKLGKLIVYSFSVVSVLIGLLALVTTSHFISVYQTNLVPLTVITILGFAIAMVVTLANIATSTLFHTTVPKEYMGRTGTVMSLAMTIAIPLGQMILGVGLDYLPAFYMIFGSAAIMLMSVSYYKKSFIEADIVQEEPVPA